MGTWTKPHPEPYLTGLNRFGATKEEALVVEDSSRGLNSAVVAGIDCVVVDNDFTKAQDFSQARYRYRAPSGAGTAASSTSQRSRSPG